MPHGLPPAARPGVRAGCSSREEPRDRIRLAYMESRAQGDELLTLPSRISSICVQHPNVATERLIHLARDLD